MADDARRRLPSVEKAIADISPEDIRVRVLGTVIDVQDSALMLDDGSGKLHVTFENPVTTKPNQLVRVFGRVIPLEQGVQLQGELVQDMSHLDVNLYKKVHALINKKLIINI
jgi:hypothetical protein